MTALHTAVGTALHTAVGTALHTAVGTAPRAADSPVGILAGNGTYPTILASSLLERGYRVVVAGIDGQFFGDLPKNCGPFSTFPLGALGATLKFFLCHGAKKIFLAGGVTRKGAWRFLRLDRYTFPLLPYVLVNRDDRLLRRVAEVIGKLGAEVCDPRPFIRDLLAGPGLLAGPEPDSTELKDIDVARRAAKVLGLRDAGQAAIAFRGKVAGCEDRNGTSALIASAPGPGAVLAKVVKPGQDLRFDLPAIGPSTAILACSVGLRAIAVETGGVLLLERDRLFDICEQKGISLLGI
ncbi:MAG: LpxI family protein [Proteobacteria bacterium]|nr:LpxI family protein [Pseudomonadota bacterium]